MDITPDGNAVSQSHTFQVLGLNSDVKARLQQIAGTEPTVGWLQYDPDKWNATNDLEGLAGKKRPPMYITTTWRAPDPNNPESYLHLAGGIWIDIDARKGTSDTILDAVAALDLTTKRLQKLEITLGCCNLFASGGKGFHVYLPIDLFTKLGDVGSLTARYFQRVSKRFVESALKTDLTDMSIYSGGQGRMFRQAGVERPNGLFKVPLSWDEWRGMTPDTYVKTCSKPRTWLEAAPITATSRPAMIRWREACSAVREADKPKAPMPKASSVEQEAERPKILKLLRAIDPASLDYRDWLRVGAALKTWGAHDALALWVAFSQQDGKRFKEGVCESKWGGLARGRAGIGSLVYLATNGGTK